LAVAGRDESATALVFKSERIEAGLTVRDDGA
jgi:hypothetical protein